MIFQRSILREKITVAAVVLFTLLTITLVLFLVKGLRAASIGNLALDGVLDIMLITTLRYFPLLVVVTAMIAITTTVARLYRDSEMAVWQASGLSGLSLLRPLAMMIVPMFLFVLFLNTVLTPWTTQQLSEYRNQSNIQELSLIKDGTFRTADSGKRVFFINKVNVNNKIPTFENIFVAQKNEKGLTMIVAQHARVENSFDNRPFLVLQDGRQYDDKVKEHIFQSIKYTQYGFSLDEFTKVQNFDPNQIPMGQKDTPTLWRDKTAPAQSELYRRLSDSFMIIPIALFALVLGHVKPRGQRSWGMLAGLLIALIYLLMIKLSEARIADERWTMNKAIWLIHGSCLALALLALWYRANAWRLSGMSLFKRSER